MKRKVDHPAPAAAEQTGRRYWRSLDELAATPGFQEHLTREFPEGASSLDGVDRRRFFKLMAAGFALGGAGLAAGCRRPESQIRAYGKSVENVIPGLPLYFASAMPHRRGAIPVLAETHQGRPTKLEGNPTYAPYGGATNAFVQASVLDLYDPDRATIPTLKGAAATAAQIDDLLAQLGQSAARANGASIAFVVGQSSSLTRDRLNDLRRRSLPKSFWVEYEPKRDEAPHAAAAAVFGAPLKPLYKLSAAQRIVSIDADFLGGEAHSLAYARDFAKARKVIKRDDAMNRLYSVESGFTLTGSMADHRLRLASSHMLAFAAALAAEVTGDAALAARAKGLEFKDQAKWITECVKDLKAHPGKALVVAGAHLPAEVHALAYAINSHLGAIGHTVDFVPVTPPGLDNLKQVAEGIRAGVIQTVVILGGNPAYNAPADSGFAEALKQAPQVVRLGYHQDETSLLAGVTIPEAHYLESWGDARTADGTIVPIQPMIQPLFGGLTDCEVLARILSLPKADGYSLTHETITGLIGDGQAEHVFRQFLHDGLLAGSGFAPAEVKLDNNGLRELLNAAPTPAAVTEDLLEVRFNFDAKVDDGRFANNGWLQECPDPITKIAWDNAILISPRLAKKLEIDPAGSRFQVARKESAEFNRGREQAFVAELTVGGRTIRGPLHIQPGLSNWTVVVTLGYGRTTSGRVGAGTGFNHYPLYTEQAAQSGYLAGATLKLIEGERYFLANTQEHWSMEGRDLVREANLDEVQKTDSHGLAYVDHMGIESHAPANLGKDKDAPLATVAATTPRGNSLYEHPDFTGTHQWGMSIDLNTCMGCNACVIACQAENNIPIVGKEQVLRGREMHWIRLDRYYSDGKLEAGAFGGPGNKEIPEDPQVSLQPVGCAHCELAPCEIVCPVNATVHDEEGLNTMAYNRCIGTRYCANNCPYKVRRFNFFDFNKREIDSLYMGPLGKSEMPELVKMAKNPDVTVRMRGVMEKCTYCVQRIQQAKIKQKVQAGASDAIVIPDGTFKVACQQVCSVEAIEFGNIKDPQSRVSLAKAREQDYALLGYLNIRPRTTYLGKLRNPNEKMPDYAALPLSRQEYNSKNHPAHGDAHGHDAHDHSSESATPGHPVPAHGEKHSSIIQALVNGGLS
jgi:MoCo/4Fe-4S cofactor protein with predicted Tat translocation signal